MRGKSPVMRNSAFILFFLVLTSFSFKLFAQSAINTPYSRFGLGELKFNQYARNSGMGGVSLGFRDAGTVNFTNPASYTAFDSTSFVFEANVTANFYNQKTLSQQQSSANGALTGLTFGFPVTRWWGASFGILPFSTIGYNIGHKESIPVLGEVKYQYQGTGGLNQVYFGNGFKLFKGLSVGTNASYIFGNLSHNSLVYSDSSAFFATDITNSTYIKGFEFTYGLQYEHTFRNDLFLVLGGVYGQEMELKANRNELALSYLPASSGRPDTIRNTTDEKGSAVLPTSMGGGFTFGKKDKWMAGADIQMQDWSKFKMYERTDSLKNSMTVAAGFAFTPVTHTSSSYFSRLEYRFGARYTQSYLNLNNTEIEELGISFGVGIPLRRTKSGFNLGFEYARRGTTDNSLIQEDLFRVKFGINVYDRWFVRRKFN